MHVMRARVNGVKKVSVPPPLHRLKYIFTSFFCHSESHSIVNFVFFFFRTQSCFSSISCPFLDAICTVSFWCVDTGHWMWRLCRSWFARYSPFGHSSLATCNDLYFLMNNKAATINCGQESIKQTNNLLVEHEFHMEMPLKNHFTQVSLHFQQKAKTEAIDRSRLLIMTVGSDKELSTSNGLVWAEYNSQCLLCFRCDTIK